MVVSQKPYTNFTASCVEVVNGFARNVTKLSSTVFTFYVTALSNGPTQIRLPWVRCTAVARVAKLLGNGFCDAVM